MANTKQQKRTANDIFTENLNLIVKAHADIVDLYNNTLYEDTWDSSVIEKFEELLSVYNDGIKEVDKFLASYVWADPAKKASFMKIYKEIIQADNIAFNAARVRHDAYLTYRSKRKTIITLLNDACGIVYKKGKNFPQVLDYFNNKCAKIPLYDNHNDKGEATVIRTSVLTNWIKPNMSEVFSEINANISIADRYTREEIEGVFAKYVHCRESAYAIFNMITSTNEVNGYKKYHNLLDSYCNADLSVKQLKRLYLAVRDEQDEFVPSDDYQQVMDQHAWNDKGIYENRFYGLFPTDIMHDKTAIKHIDMVPRNANQCMILSDGQSVYTANRIYTGDIIEICPTKMIDKTALYSKDMRDIVFEVERNEKYVIPFGYCQYYDIADETHEPNCDYMWDPNQRVIVIKAIKNLPKHTKLYLNIVK